jgi:hypothetical protein
MCQCDEFVLVNLESFSFSLPSQVLPAVLPILASAASAGHAADDAEPHLDRKRQGQCGVDVSGPMAVEACSVFSASDSPRRRSVSAFTHENASTIERQRPTSNAAGDRQLIRCEMAQNQKAVRKFL